MFNELAHWHTVHAAIRSFQTDDLKMNIIPWLLDIFWRGILDLACRWERGFMKQLWSKNWGWGRLVVDFYGSGDPWSPSSAKKKKKKKKKLRCSKMESNFNTPTTACFYKMGWQHVLNKVCALSTLICTLFLICLLLLSIFLYNSYTFCRFSMEYQFTW